MFLTEFKLRSLIRKALLTESHADQEGAFVTAFKQIQQQNIETPDKPIDIVFANGSKFENVKEVIGTGKDLNEFGFQSYTDIKIKHITDGQEVTTNISMKGPKTPAFAGGGAAGIADITSAQDVFESNIVVTFLNGVKNYIINNPDLKLGPHRDFLKHPHGNPPTTDPTGFYALLTDILSEDQIKAIMRGTEPMGGPISYYIKGNMRPTSDCDISGERCRLVFNNLNLYTIDEAYNQFVAGADANGLHIFVRRGKSDRPVNVLLGQQGETTRSLSGLNVPYIFGEDEKLVPMKARYEYEVKAFKDMYPSQNHPKGFVDLKETMSTPDGRGEERYAVLDAKIYDKSLADKHDYGYAKYYEDMDGEDYKGNPSYTPSMTINNVNIRGFALDNVALVGYVRELREFYGSQREYTQSINITENPSPGTKSRMIKIDLN